MTDDWDIPPDEYYEDQHRRKLQGMLRHLPPGHPDEDDIKAALEELGE